jgi:hypothetical protein
MASIRIYHSPTGEAAAIVIRASCPVNRSTLGPIAACSRSASAGQERWVWFQSNGWHCRGLPAKHCLYG